MTTLPRATGLVLLAAVLGAALSMTGGAVAVAQPTGDAPVTWGVVPSGQDGPDGRSAFTYTLDPGGEVADMVGVVNYTEAPLSLRVNASDATRGTDGGFDLLPVSRKSAGVGAWARVGEEEVTVPPRSRVDVPFRIVVPRDATPGDHAGGIVASLRTEGEAADGTVSVDRRVGTRIYVRITGTLNPSLAVGDPRASFHGSPLGLPGEIRVTYVVRNDGNLRLLGRPSLRVSGPFGVAERQVAGERLAELKPGDSVEVSTVVPGVWQLGRVNVEVTVTPEDSGDQELRPRPAADTASARLWVVPWVPLAVTALAVAIAVGWWRRRRARRTADSSSARALGESAPSRRVRSTTAASDARRVSS